MKFILAVGVLLSFASFSHAQQPEEKVPRLIAKVPERSDFFGEWLRYDGTYKLSVEKGKDGTVVAKYFNPKSIKVESAKFHESDGAIVLTVVLRDEGYPGSTYQLSYDSSYRILVGGYLMPASGQRNQVYFNEVEKK